MNELLILFIYFLAGLLIVGMAWGTVDDDETVYMLNVFLVAATWPLWIILAIGKSIGGRIK